MTKKRYPTIERTSDRDGSRIVRVSLGNSQTPAKLFEDDFNALRANGITDYWFLNGVGNDYQYVRENPQLKQALDNDMKRGNLVQRFGGQTVIPDAGPGVKQNE